MKTKKKKSTASNRLPDDEVPIQKSAKAIWVAIFILVILAGLAYLLFSTLSLEGELNKRGLLTSIIAVMLLIMGLLVFVGAWFKPTKRKKKKKSPRAVGRKSTQQGKKPGRKAQTARKLKTKKK